MYENSIHARHSLIKNALKEECLLALMFIWFSFRGCAIIVGRYRGRKECNVCVHSQL